MQSQSLETRHKRALQVGVAFVKEFFTKLSTDPSSAADLYASDSVLYDLEGTYDGHEAIREYIERLAGGYKFSFDTVLAQASSGGNVCLTLRGLQLTKTETTSFARTMILVQASDKSFLVQNDVMLEMRKESNDLPTPKTTKQPERSNGRAAPSATPSAAPEKEPTPTPAATFSWADKLKAASSAAPSTAPQRVVGGQNAAESPKKPEKKEAKKGKEGGGASGGDRKDKSGKGGQYPAEMFQHAALYVSNLTDEMTETHMEEIFSKFGKIVGKTFKAGSYCFIDFADKSAVQAACAERVCDY